MLTTSIPFTVRTSTRPFPKDPTRASSTASIVCFIPSGPKSPAWLFARFTISTLPFASTSAYSGFPLNTKV